MLFKKMFYLLSISTLFMISKTPIDACSNSTSIVLENDSYDSDDSDHSAEIAGIENSYFSKMGSDSYYKNDYGSCGFNGISMLLNYYDAVYDGNLIQDIYQKNGTVNSNGLVSPTGLKYSNEVNNAVEFYEKNLDGTLLGNLFKIYYMYNHIGNGPKEGYFGLSDRDVENILTQYLILFTSGKMKFASLDIPSEQAIKNKLQEHIPVLLCAEKKDNNGKHCFVAYKTENNKIICNMGWGDEQTSVYGLDYFPNVTCAYYIDIPENYHVCTKMFGKNNCLCKFTQMHNITCTNYDMTYHAYVCGCGLLNKEKHQFIQNGTSKICKICKASVSNDSAIILKKKEEIE